MKTRKSILVTISILTLLVLVGAGATGKKTCVAADSEEYYGTWINPDYNGMRKHAKLILRPDGTWAQYLNDSDTRRMMKELQMYFECKVEIPFARARKFYVFFPTP